jgi:hypothetical protein
MDLGTLSDRRAHLHAICDAFESAATVEAAAVAAKKRAAELLGDRETLLPAATESAGDSAGPRR